jgi:hypothetical protein
VDLGRKRRKKTEDGPIIVYALDKQTTSMLIAKKKRTRTRTRRRFDRDVWSS